MKMNKKFMLAVGAVSMLMGTSPASLMAKSKKNPNIILILADDLGYGDVSCLNAKSKIQTPNIDKMASNGVTFADAHSSSSVCTPSRYSLMTGRYAWKTRLKRGVLGGSDKALMLPGRRTIASILKSKGYNTACVGKWHLGMDFGTTDGKVITPKTGKNLDFTKKIANGPTTFGFDYFFGIPGSMDMSPYMIVENTRFLEQPDTIVGRGNPYGRPGYAMKGRGPEWFLPAFTDKVEDKIDEYSEDDKPFFIYFPLNAPHTPVAPSSKFKGKNQIGEYGDFVTEVDDVIGRVIKALKSNGIEENTLVILTSDNGPETICYNRYLSKDHNSSGYLKGVKRDLWEGGHRVPFFAQWPEGIESGITTNQTICLADVFSTAAEIVNYSCSKDEGEDSYSFLSLLKGKDKKTRPYTIHHSARGDFAIRKDEWVFIEKGDGNSNSTTRRGFAEYYKKLGYTDDTMDGYLYNLTEDIKEYNDLAKKNQSKVDELNKILQKAKAGYE
ncbi:arylsulfatase [Puteibacter caeruleilacunae]|nr:arylsulfatase [Puteibacter caeruleilacunae]